MKGNCELKPIKQQMWTDVLSSIFYLPHLSTSGHCPLPPSHHLHVTAPLPSPPPALPSLSTSVQYHFWYSPGYSTSPPRPEKSSSSSCSIRVGQPHLGSHPARLKPRTAETPPARPGHSVTAAACKERGGLRGSTRRKYAEERCYLWALWQVARCGGYPPLYRHWRNSTGWDLQTEKLNI